MMPFSILRTWSLGLLSWAILGAAIYSLYEWTDRAAPRIAQQEDGSQQWVIADENAWPLLAVGVALLLWNFIGFLPIKYLLGKRVEDDPRPLRNGDTRRLERPDGTQLNVEVYGQAGAPTLICTHGWSLNSTEWYYVKRLLGDQYRVVVWDLPGLGRSRGPKNHDYRLEKMAADLDAVMESVAPGEKVFLVGHSIGGMITQTYCRLYAPKLAQRVAGIVLTHTTYQNPLTTALFAPLWKALEKPLIVPLNYLTIALWPLAWVQNWQSYLNGTLHIASRFSSFAGNQTVGQVDYSSRLFASAHPGVTARGNLAMLEFNADPTLPNIEVPTLVIGGNHDRLTKIEASQHIEQRLPHGLLTTVDAGHLGLWERYEDVCGAIEQFVEKYSERPSSPRSDIARTFMN